MEAVGCCLVCDWSLTAFKHWPIPMATAPAALMAPEARNAPPAPALMAGIEGMDPTVMRMADMADMTFGCSTVRNSSAPHALTSHAGAVATVIR